MKINYTENEKRHIFESESGHLSTFLKERLTKEQAESLFVAQLANEGIEVTQKEHNSLGEDYTVPIKDVIPLYKKR